MKQCIKVYLEPDDINRLKDKASKIGFNGRGALSKYFRKISKEPICFLDDNARAILQAMAP